MAISETAQKNHEELFPNLKSTLRDTDPELIEVFDNFAFDEVLSYGNLDTKIRLMVILAGALPVFTRAEAFFRDIAIQHRIEGVVVEGTAQSEHGIAIFFQPPGPGALQPNVTDVFIG